MDHLAAAAGIKGASTPEPVSNVRHGGDLEAGAAHLNRLSSKVGMPLDRRNSMPLDAHGGTQDGEDEAPETQEDEEEYAWGPSHPCFPHLNPHVPLASPLHASTRIVRVKRDWMVAGDLAPTFANLYPEVLDPLVSEETFRSVIKKINSELLAAFKPFGARAWIDALLGTATLWLWEDLGFTGVKARLRRLESWIQEWNRKVGEPEGVKIIELRRTGYLSIDIQIPDPQISIEPVPTTRGSSEHHDNPPAMIAPGMGSGALVENTIPRPVALA